MNLKPLARKILLFLLLGADALIICGHLFPIYEKVDPITTVSLWETCETLASARFCYPQFALSSSQCSEMDARLTMMVTFSVIWFVNNLEMCAVVVWELLEKPVPVSSHLMFGWSAACGTITVILILQTLVANLCGSPLTFSEQGGKYKIGGMFLSIALGATLLGFLLYFVAPETEDEEKQGLTKPGTAA